MKNIETVYESTLGGQILMVSLISVTVFVAILAVWYFWARRQPKFHWPVFLFALLPALFFGLLLAFQFFHIGLTQLAFEEILPMQARTVTESMESQLNWYVIIPMVAMYGLCVAVGWLATRSKNTPELVTA